MRSMTVARSMLPSGAGHRMTQVVRICRSARASQPTEASYSSTTGISRDIERPVYGELIAEQLETAEAKDERTT
jgi:hypothetical protein